jgi:hypothetical protein
MEKLGLHREASPDPARCGSSTLHIKVLVLPICSGVKTIVLSRLMLDWHGLRATFR